jgi:hypothetical protein
MRQWIRSHLTYANVVATLSLFFVLGGISYAATGDKFILGQSNTASSKSTLSAPIADKALTVTNSSTKPGAMALGLNVASGHPPFKVNSPTKVANLNADKLDGQDSTAFGQVREFSHSIAAASAGPPPFDMATFRGLKLSSEGVISNGTTLGCELLATATDPGRLDGFGIKDGQVFQVPSSSNPANSIVAEAVGPGSSNAGQLVFRNAATGRVLTVAFSIDVPFYGDINNASCFWQGTMTAAG